MKTLRIDELLTWAFVDELPKGGGVEGLENANSAWRLLEASSWGKITRWAEYMATIQRGRRDADNFMIEQGAPHDDALAVGEAVNELAKYEIVIPAGWSPLCDWPRDDVRMGPLIEEAVARAVDRFMLRRSLQRAAHLVSLIVGSAVLGQEPRWEAPVSAIRMVERAGRPAWFLTQTVKDVFGRKNAIEVDGYNARSGRPHRGAYRKFELSDDPVGDVLGRLDRELWVAALRMLERRLANRLVGHRLATWDGEGAPWGSVGPRISLVERKGAAAKIPA